MKLNKLQKKIILELKNYLAIGIYFSCLAEGAGSLFSKSRLFFFEAQGIAPIEHNIEIAFKILEDKKLIKFSDDRSMFSVVGG